MLELTITLHGAISGKSTRLGTIIIDNIGTGTSTRGDYRVRAFPKGGPDDPVLRLLGVKPHRQGRVLGHRRLAEPVWSLALKALQALGYASRTPSAS